MCNIILEKMFATAHFVFIHGLRCVEGAYTFCPYLVPPKTFTSLAIPPVAEYINMWYCKYTTSVSRVVLVTEIIAESVR